MLVKGVVWQVKAMSKILKEQGLRLEQAFKFCSISDLSEKVDQYSYGEWLFDRDFIPQRMAGLIQIIEGYRPATFLEGVVKAFRKHGRQQDVFVRDGLKFGML